MFIVLILFILVVAGVVWFLLAHDRGAKEPVGALWAALGFGVLALAPTIYLENKLPIHSASVNVGVAFLTFLGVGFIEETCKFLPLALFIYKKPYFNEHTDGIIYFAMSGLAFGLAENFEYTVFWGAAVGLSRLLLVPFFHAAGTGMVGYFLSRAKLQGKSRWHALWALALVAVIHGIYDFGLSTGVGVIMLISVMITILFTLGLILFWMHANELDKAQGLSAIGHNKFCRSCGRPNVNHSLYCVFCGRPA